MFEYSIDDLTIVIEDIREAGIQGYNFIYSDNSSYSNASINGIKIFNKGLPVASAAISAVAGGTGVHRTSHIVETSRIVLCCANSVFCLSVPHLALLWRTEADFAACFQVFKYQDDYIVHGEVAITRIDNSGDIVWQQSGADIFVSLDGSDKFALTENYIETHDWNKNQYRFDYNGKSHPV